MSIEDCDGNPVSKGSVIKVLKVDPALLQALPKDDRKLVESMVANEYIVEEIEDGFAVVSEQWNFQDGNTHFQTISLSKNEMKLVR